MSTSPEAQLAAFLGKYTEEVQAQFRLARAKLHSLFPRGFELVYDNYNALVFTFSPTSSSASASRCRVGRRPPAFNHSALRSVPVKRPSPRSPLTLLSLI